MGINNEAVTIENIEKQIIEKAFENNWINANNKVKDTNKKIAIIGSGPAGLAAADQLNKAGHNVTIYEKSDLAGGLLRYGIPDFKLEKWVIDRRLDVLKKAGIEIITNTDIGNDININDIKNSFDAIVLCGGSSVPRDINVAGREASGIYFAMDYLEMSNKYVKSKFKSTPSIYAKDKHVVVIGGGDTGADCVGTANRQGASSVNQIELLFKPSLQRNDQDPWPLWPMILRTSSSHDEGCERKWSIQTKRFIKDGTGTLIGLEVEDIDWKWNEETKKHQFTAVPNTMRTIDCDLIFIAAGFLHPKQEGMINQIGLQTDNNGNIVTKNYQTNHPSIFAAGDMRRGQSLVVWAISEGREAARAVDQYLMGHTRLETKNSSSLVMA